MKKGGKKVGTAKVLRKRKQPQKVDVPDLQDAGEVKGGAVGLQPTFVSITDGTSNTVFGDGSVRTPRPGH